MESYWIRSIPCKLLWNTKNTLFGRKKHQLHSSISFLIDVHRYPFRICIGCLRCIFPMDDTSIANTFHRPSFGCSQPCKKNQTKNYGLSYFHANLIAGTTLRRINRQRMQLSMEHHCYRWELSVEKLALETDSCEERDTIIRAIVLNRALGYVIVAFGEPFILINHTFLAHRREQKLKRNRHKIAKMALFGNK